MLPDELETIPPGPYLAVILAGVDRTRLNGHDVVRMMQSHKRLAAHYEAASLADMVEVAHCPPGDADSPAERNSEPEEFASDDIRAALCLTRRPPRGGTDRLGSGQDDCLRHLSSFRSDRP